MKISRSIFASLLLCLFGISFVHSQDKSEKKSKDKKAEPRAIEVKANLMVLDADGKFADIKLEDLKIYEDSTEQKITYFAKKENALNIGLVMDNTGSMRTQLEKIITAGRTFVSNLRPQDETFLVRFVNSEKIHIVQEWTSNKTLLSNALENMYIQGGASAIIDGLYLSANKILEREKADKSKRGALILITDGEDRDSYYKREQLFDLFKGSDVQIFTIGLVGELPSDSARKSSVKFINQLALETSGAAFILQGKNKEIENTLVQSLKAILTELNSQYVIGYTSTNQKRDGLSRKLTVQIADGAKGEKRQAFIRESFVVPEEKNK
ncbi:MAG: VWA domain-containing protein [Acidobacteriota bacterium]|nr:VWA domain-containing protein [Acidobacteriota bacterium]